MQMCVMKTEYTARVSSAPKTRFSRDWFVIPRTLTWFSHSTPPMTVSADTSPRKASAWNRIPKFWRMIAYATGIANIATREWR